MSEAPAAPVTENGVPPAAQDSSVQETPGFKVHIPTYLTWHDSLFISPSSQVFAGNLAYSTSDDGLKAFFAPVEKDMYVFLLSPHLLALFLALIAIFQQSHCPSDFPPYP